jgi:hypothetical protein
LIELITGKKDLKWKKNYVASSGFAKKVKMELFTGPG